METPLQTKSVNALFAFLKSALLCVKQMTTGFFTSKMTGLSLIPIYEFGLSKPNLKKKSLNNSFSMALVLLSLFFVTAVSAQTNTWDGSSSNNWNTSSNWSLNQVPTSAHDVIIPDNEDVTVNTAAVCKSFTIDSGGNDNTISISSSNSLTVTNAVTIGAGTGDNDDKIIAVGSGTLNCGSMSFANTSNNTRNVEVTISTGTVTVSGNIVMSGASGENAIRFSSTGLLKVGSAISGGTIVASSGTVEYYGNGTGGTTANQTIANYTYNNLETSGSGTKTLAANTTASETVTVSAGTTLALSNRTLSAPSSLVLENGGTASTISGTGLLTLGGNVTVNKISGTGVGALISCPIALTNASSRTFAIADETTAVADLTISGIISTTGAIIKAGLGNMVLSGANTYTGGTTISAGTLSINSTTALGAAANNLTIASGAVANVAANITVGNLTLGGAGTASGTWGFTGSGATYINTTYFTSTAGVITVSNNTSITPTVTVTPIGTYTYNGSSQGPITATNTGPGTSYTFSYVGVSGTTYLANVTPPTNAGSYTVTATVAAVNGFSSAASSVATAFTINKVALTIGAPTIASKAYDGNTTAGAVTVGSLTGFIGSQTVTTTATAANYSSANVNSYSGVLITYTLVDGTNGGLAINYSLANGSATGVITAKILTIGAPSIASKVYDNTATAGAVTLGTLSGFIGTQTVTATATAANYSSANVNSYPGVVILYTLANGLNGGLATNYSLANGSATGVITAKVLTIGTPTIVSKTYDGTTTAGSVTEGALSGFIGTQTVTAIGSGANYSSANVGSYSGVVISYTLANGTNGGLATNYSLANGSATGVITAKALTIGSPTIASKIYDGNTTAGAVTVGSLSGFIGSETVTTTATAANYSSANVNSYSGVVITYTLANGLNGGLATNYSLANGTATGVITAGPFVKMQILLPGETSAPGTPSGKTGTPTSQVSGVAFTATVHAVDAFWNVVTSAPANIIAITTSDVNDTHPGTNTLSSGTRTFSITLKTVGSSTVTATNSSDGSKTANTSPSVTVTPGIKTTDGDGNWNDPNTWSPVGVPYLSDQVYIIGADDVIVTANATCASINFTDENSSLSVNSGITLTVTGAVTLDSYNDDTDTSAEILGDGTLNADSLNVGLASILNNNDGSDNTLDITIATLNLTGDITIYNNDEGGGDANRPGLYINSPSVLSASKVAMIQTGNGGGGSRIITFDVDNGATVNLSGGLNPITISSEIALRFDDVFFDLGSSSTINYNGTVTQNIPAGISNSRAGGTTNSSVPVNYGNLTINNTSVAGLTTSGNVTVSGTLTLTDGIVTTGANTIIVTNVTTPISGGSDASYVSGKLRITYPATGTNVGRTFPVGKEGVYSPVLFTYATAPSSRNVTIEQFETGSPFTSAASLATFGSRYWNVTQSATGVAYRVGLNDGGSTAPSGSSVVILRRNNGTISSNASSYSAPNYTNVTSFANTSGILTNDVALGVNNIPLSITGVSVINTKVYNGNTIATVIGTPTLSGSISPGDVVTLSGTAVYTFDTKNVGTGKAVTVSGLTLSGANASGYALPTNQILGLTGDITVRPITVTAVSNTKTYNGTTSSSGVPTYTLQSGDTTTTAPTQSFDTKDIGVTKTLTPIGLVINDGNGGNNYSISYAPVNLGTINAKLVTASIAATVISKPYDGTTNATLTTANYNLVGIVGSEDVTISNTSGTYDTKNFGINKTVTVTGLTLGGTDAGNYSISNPTSINGNVGTITKVNLIPSLTGIVSKPYDGNTSATLTAANYILGGLVPLEDVMVTNTSGTYDNKNVLGSPTKTVTVTGLTIAGADIANYTISSSVNGTIGEITAIGLTITGATSFDKVYDTTTAAIISNGSLVGILGADEVLLIQEGTFSTDNAGGPYTVTAACRITGEDAGNYFLTQPMVPNASITRKEVTIIDMGTIDKVYDTTNIATLIIVPPSGSVVGTRLAGVFTGDIVGLDPSGYFFDGTNPVSNVGTWDIISTTTLTGLDAANYILSQPIFSNQKKITPVGLDVTGITADNKVYDGNTAAVINTAGATLSGVLVGETAGVTLSTAGATGAFDTEDFGAGKTVTIAGLSISGVNASNYSINTTNATSNIDRRPITITSIDQTKCAGDAFSGSGDLNIGFIKDYNVAGDLLSVTLTVIGGDGSLSGSYPLRPSLATPRASNYIVTSVDGTLTVNQSPTAIISGNVATCIGSSPLVTFTGTNGSGTTGLGGTLQYEFTYKVGVSGTPTTITTDLGSATTFIVAPTAVVGAVDYILLGVRDIVSGCSQTQAGTVTITTGTCTQIRAMQCGQFLPTIDTVIQSNPVPGATQYRFEITLTTAPNTVTVFTWPNYYFNPTTVVPGGGMAYGKEYNIRVKPFIGATEFPYADACIIKAPLSPPPSGTLTKIRPMQCGKTMNYITDAIQAIPVYLATQYEFEVTDGVTTLVIPSNTYWFRLSQFPGGGVLNTAYTIRVRSSDGPAPAPFTDWGDSCVVTTPIARMSDVSNNDVFEVKSFPNPFASHFSLDIESSSDDVVEMKVFDMIGRQLEANQATVSELSTRDIGRNYPSGVYNVIVSQGNKVKSIRMVKR